MKIIKQEDVNKEQLKALEQNSDLIAPEGYVYRHKHLAFIPPVKYIKLGVWSILLGKPLTKERIKEIFGADQEPPYVESEADYELIEEEDEDHL